MHCKEFGCIILLKQIKWRMIMGEDKFYIVNEKSLPEIFKKVIEVKENIELGNAKDISEAIKLGELVEVHITSIKMMYFQ